MENMEGGLKDEGNKMVCVSQNEVMVCTQVQYKINKGNFELRIAQSHSRSLNEHNESPWKCCASFKWQEINICNYTATMVLKTNIILYHSMQK